MKRTITAACAAAALALGLGLSASAQSSSSATQRSQMNASGTVTVTGCLQKTNSGGYWLIDPITRNGMQPSTQDQATNQGQSGMEASTNPAAWNLQGDNDKWDTHVGQEVQITGSPERSTSSDKLKGQGDHAQEVTARDLDVHAVRVVSPSCQRH
jgi:hypothetical protein